MGERPIPRNSNARFMQPSRARLRETTGDADADGASSPHQASFGSKGPVAHETLLLDSGRGDATLFMRRGEVAAWAHLPAADFPKNAAGSEGPASCHDLLKIRGNRD
jgi:glucose-6-phosphate 1-dehydrogenase